MELVNPRCPSDKARLAPRYLGRGHDHYIDRFVFMSASATILVASSRTSVRKNVGEALRKRGPVKASVMVTVEPH